MRRSEYFDHLIDHDRADYVLRIDRDGTHFRYILNYLRGSPHLPAKDEALQEMAIEADFYCLHELRDEILARISFESRQRGRGKCRPGTFAWIKSKISTTRYNMCKRLTMSR